MALVVQGPLHDGFGVGAWLGIPVTLVGLTVLWWWTQHLLLGGLVGWRPLLPGAVIIAIALTALTATARLDEAIGVGQFKRAVNSGDRWGVVVRHNDL
ncbi:hypothetical protein [Streptomyces sp. NPDC002758]